MRYVYYNPCDVINYSRNANAYQKIRMLVEHFDGYVVPDGKLADVLQDEFKARLISPSDLTRRDVRFVSYPNEIGLLKTLIKSFWWKAFFVFCWDPPGVTVRDRTDFVSRLRCRVMDVLLALVALRSRGVVLNLHPGFLADRIPKFAHGKFRSFLNGTMVVENRKMAGGVAHVPKRISINNAFWSHKACWEIARLVVRLWKADPEVSVAWVGYAAEHEKVMEFLRDSGMPSDHIVSPGKCSLEDAMRILASGSIALNAYPDNPSLHWNYILKAPEFLSLGLPVVSSDMPGVRAYVIENETGLFFNPGDWDAAFERLVDLLNRPDVIRKMSACCCSASENFDWNEINGQIAEFIWKRFKAEEGT